MKICILVDSASTGTPSDYKDSVVEMIPLHITKSDGVDFFDTAENAKKNNLFESIKQGVIWKTSQASIGEIEAKYDELLAKYDYIVHLPIASNLSSMMATSMIVAKEDKYADKVTVIENDLLAAQALKEMALHLSNLIKNETITTPEQAVEEFNNWSKQMYVALIPSDLKKLAHGGRAVKVVSTVLNIFKTKLLICWGPSPEKEGIGRTISGLVSKVIDHVKKDSRFKNGYKLIFLTSPANDEKVTSAAKQAFNDAKVKFCEEMMSNLYVVHAGLDTLGFIIVPTK